jgi:hypothetical protein
MKRFIIIVLVAIVVGVGFYLGYQKAVAPKQQSGSTNQKTIITSNPATIPANAITRETTMVVNLDTPTTIFDADGLNKRLEVTVQTNPAKSNTANKNQFLMDMKLTSLGPVMQESTLKIATIENQQFKIAIASTAIDGKLNTIDDKQVSLTIKLSTW